mmetsp:Transcript_4089/g.6104  ORF Transcript_4089/g.6104 Transcript_4089/m.6104 type:complete len:129 (-) Transcript_4089:500-886(-)|eukprot:scaffold275056_cov35-Tisochrysis_lutea.AAC.3
MCSAAESARAWYMRRPADRLTGRSEALAKRVQISIATRIDPSDRTVGGRTCCMRTLVSVAYALAGAAYMEGRWQDSLPREPGCRSSAPLLAERGIATHYIGFASVRLLPTNHCGRWLCAWSARSIACM